MYFVDALSDDRTHDIPRPSRSIELAQEEILPCGQAELAIDDWHRLRWSHQPGLEMGIPIAVLPVMEPHAPRDEFPQQVDHIHLDAIVPILLDHHGRRGALDIHVDESIGDTAVVYHGPDLGRDVDEFRMSVCFDLNDFMHDFQDLALSDGDRPHPIVLKSLLERVHENHEKELCTKVILHP